MWPTRIVLVDNHRIFLAAMARFLATHAGLEVVGWACSGQEALELVPRLNPDLVLLDLVMPDLSGLAVAQQIKAQPDAPYVIVLTLYDELPYRAAAAEAPVDGFVSKVDAGTQLLPLIDHVVRRGMAAKSTDGHPPAWAGRAR
jgi:DNA-binding NarL/FixJ family response regulator